MARSSHVRLDNIEFIRAVCAIGIICFHFAHGADININFAVDTANGAVGSILVVVFFALSGGVLYYNHPYITSISRFYYKRWKAIFPSFYIAYSGLYLIKVHRGAAFFYDSEAAPWTIVLSVLGIDGYFEYAIHDYYILGEWFLGAIIMLYICYPILVYAINKMPIRSACLLLAGYIWVMRYDRFEISQFRNLISCVCMFYVGMIIMKYRDVWEKRITIIGMAATVIALVLFVVPIPYLPQAMAAHITGLILFASLYWIGMVVMRFAIPKRILSELGAISYQIFLLQHVVIELILKIYQPTNNAEYYVTLIITIVVTILFSELLALITRMLIHSVAFQDFEHYIYKNIVHKAE